ncbi:hypothetical protein [Streptomyces sp. NPDC127112]
MTAFSSGRTVVAVSGDAGPELTKATDALTMAALELTVDLPAMKFMD